MPVPVLIGEASTLAGLVVNLPPVAHQLAEAFWPGGLTLVLEHAPSLAWDLGDAEGTVAVRLPDDDVARDLLRRTGPLAVSSANRSGRPAADDRAGGGRPAGHHAAVVLDGGPRAGSAASTIVDCTGPRPRVLRVGAISVDRLREVAPDSSRTERRSRGPTVARTRGRVRGPPTGEPAQRPAQERAGAQRGRGTASVAAVRAGRSVAMSSRYRSADRRAARARASRAPAPTHLECARDEHPLLGPGLRRPGRLRPRHRRRRHRRAGPPAQRPPADRQRELHQPGRARRAGQHAVQQVRRGLSRTAVLRRLRGRRPRRGDRHRARQGALRRRARQPAAALRRQRQPGRLRRVPAARRHLPRHGAAARRPPDPRHEGVLLRQVVQRRAVRRATRRPSTSTTTRSATSPASTGRR